MIFKKPILPKPKWSEEMLQDLKLSCVDFLPGEKEFEKQDNVLLNGLKNFSPSNEVYCPKCDTNARVTKNGKTKDTYQFVCNNGDKQHYLSATQILDQVPDEWLLDFLEPVRDGYRSQILNWLGKEYLSTENWEIKGMKNATKRFASELSPIKGSDIKIRAVNSSLEHEVKELKILVESMLARQNVLEDENSVLKSALKAAREEAYNLRRYLSEEKEVTKPVRIVSENEATYAAVANIHKPDTRKKLPTMTPLEVISKLSRSDNVNQSNEEQPKKYAFSPLKLIYFEGCQRRNPSLYRQMFRDVGLESKSVRDITFLAEDILQITTYESSVAKITETLESISSDVRRLENFNPCKASNYERFGAFTDEQVKASYFALMSKSAERIKKASENVKSLKRTAAFMGKIVELQTTSYEPTIRKPRCFVLGDFYNLKKENEETTESMEVAEESVSEPLSETELMEIITNANQNEGGQ